MLQRTSPPVLECDRPHVANYVRARLEVQALETPPHGSSIMLGDSIIEQGLWTEWLGPRWVNRGIGSASIALVVQRAHEITALKPAAVYLSAGVNDLNHGRDPKDVAHDARSVLAHLEDSGIDAIWLSILPVGRTFRGGKLNPLIAEANALVNWPFTISLWNWFEHEGAMREGLTYDDVHLNGAGYELFLKAMREA